MHPYQTFTSAPNRKPGSGPAGPAREGGRWESRGNHGGTGAGSPQIPFGPSGAVLRKAYTMPMGKKVWLCKSSQWLPLRPFGPPPLCGGEASKRVQSGSSGRCPPLPMGNKEKIKEEDLHPPLFPFTPVQTHRCTAGNTSPSGRSDSGDRRAQ